MKKNSDSNKEMADLFYNLYMGCVTYKDKKKEKNINCDHYFEKFKFFAEKYVDNNSKSNI